MSEKESVQAHFRAAADRAAHNAVVRHSELRGDQAKRVARHTVAAAAPALHAEHAAKLTKTSTREEVAGAVLVVAALALDLAAFTSMAIGGNRRTRLLAGAAGVAHTGLVLHVRHRKHRIRDAARAEATG